MAAPFASSRLVRVVDSRCRWSADLGSTTVNRNGFSNRVGERLLQERVDETAVRHSAADQHIVEGRDGEVVGGEEGGQRLCELIELLPHDVLPDRSD